MAILGAHMSIAGGFHLAVLRAHDCACDCVQLFTKNNSQWRSPPIRDSQAEQFKQALTQHRIRYPLAHHGYLINLASPDPDLWRKSAAAFADELRRAEMLAIPYVVTHPGSYTTSTLRAGIRRIVRALDRVRKETAGIQARCLLETTAGQGTSLGWRFEQLAAILDQVQHPERLGVCFDTCHVFAAGYPLRTAAEYDSTIEALDRTVGLGRVRAFHLNDSSHDLGSRVDRHAHIGRGRMGLEPFRRLLADPRFQQTPMYLETPKAEEGGEDLDAVNLRVLRSLR
jgi:deoxyribonuclease-4